MYLGKLALIEV